MLSKLIIFFHLTKDSFSNAFHVLLQQFAQTQQPVYEGETALCCKSFPVSFWERCVKKVDIKITSTNLARCTRTDALEISKGVTRSVFEDEGILKKIDGLTDS